METSARHAMAVPEITSSTTIFPPLPFFNPLPHQATPTPTPTTSEATTSIPPLLDFSSVFRQEAQDEKNAYIELVDTSMRAIIKEEVNTQLPQILPQAVSDFANPVIEKNVTESLEVVVLTRSSLQPKSTYEAAASLSKFELTKILLDKMEESKSHLIADHKKNLYEALVESYNTDKELFNSYGEVFTLKRSRDDKDKDQDPSSAYAEEPSHTVDDSGVQQDQEFDTVNNDEQPADKEVTKDDWFKKPERPPTPDSDWNKRQHVDSRPSQAWISQIARSKECRTLFDELMDTSFDFSTFVINWLNIKDLTQEILGGPTFELLKGTCKSLTELEYHLEEYHRGRQVIPQDFFINNDLEYLKGGDFSRRYTTSVRKTKAATYKIKWIEDLFAANMTSSKDVYSRKIIIAVTRLTIRKKYDYGHLEKIEVRREDQKLQNWRDLPRDIPLDSVEVLRYEKRSKSENKGKVPTEMELVLEQTQQGTSYEVSVSAEGVEELKRKVKIKSKKKEVLLTLRQKPGQYICCQES
ncbi:hypothetical protein Tco_0066607 [Tanacetum coccineum]